MYRTRFFGDKFESSGLLHVVGQGVEPGGAATRRREFADAPGSFCTLTRVAFFFLRKSIHGFLRPVGRHPKRVPDYGTEGLTVLYCGDHTRGDRGGGEAGLRTRVEMILASPHISVVWWN